MPCTRHAWGAAYQDLRITILLSFARGSSTRLTRSLPTKTCASGFAPFSQTYYKAHVDSRLPGPTHHALLAIGLSARGMVLLSVRATRTSGASSSPPLLLWFFRTDCFLGPTYRVPLATRLLTLPQPRSIECLLSESGLPDPDTVLDQYPTPFSRPLTSDLMLLEPRAPGKGANERGC